MFVTTPLKNSFTSVFTVDIPQTDSVKYLGIHIDRKLNWKHHITKKEKKQSK